MKKTIADRLIEAKTGLSVEEYLREALAAGKSATAIGQEIGISHTGVAKLLKRHGHRAGWAKVEVA